ncbi:Cytochrome monooxygenase lcsI [Penicillium malachiteum]|uniref:Cytochrome monooxygenase lcsI n=1 Tax=Penicillium malachiteum TaxID=1324776 RepID=UPI0025486247|nr:Cytochrome monooxygenase lcsI [Penicillium malachiteum]KAJ5720735.1 Cytochrome monooxygenase lcsI [Penicillium malachiteum]
MPPSIINPCIAALDSIHIVPAILLVLIAVSHNSQPDLNYLEVESVLLSRDTLLKLEPPVLWCHIMECGRACQISGTKARRVLIDSEVLARTSLSSSNIPTIYWTRLVLSHSLLNIHVQGLGTADAYFAARDNSIQNFWSCITSMGMLPELWKDIYGHRKAGAEPFLKDPTFFPVGPYGTNLLNSNDEDHARGRGLLSHAFSEKSLREQEELIQSYADLLVSRLNEEMLTSRNIFDLSRWYNYTTFDIIGDLAYGEPFDCLKNSEYHPWVSMVSRTSKGSALLRAASLYPWLAPVVKASLPQETMRLRREHMELNAQKAQRRLDRKTDRPDFMTAVLKNEHQSMSGNELKANASLFIIAGSETTASLLSGFTYDLLENSIAYQKLKKEVRETFQSYDGITFHAVSTLPYLNAALEEGLRCFPPVAGIFPRVVPKGGSMIDGEFVPEGTSVAGAHLATYHAESNFAEPDSFIPERWLENKDKRFESDDLAAFAPFSLGPRNCIGKNLAYAEMRVIAAKMIWTFDMRLDPSSTGWNDQRSFIVWERKPLMVHLSKVLH